MNNPMMPDRILIENTIIAVATIVTANYEPTARILAINFVDKSKLIFRDDSAEAVWDFLKDQLYGCYDLLPNWKPSKPYSPLGDKERASR